jgi:hypothetical protein
LVFIDELSHDARNTKCKSQSPSTSYRSVEVYVSQLLLLLICMLGRIQYTCTTIPFKHSDATGPSKSLAISVNHIHKIITTRKAPWAQLAPSFKPGVRGTNKFKLSVRANLLHSKISINSSKNKIMRRENIKEKTLLYCVESTQKPIPIAARPKAWVCG